MSVAVVAAGTAGATVASLPGVRWEHPGLIFGGSTIAAIAGLIAATVLIAAADRREVAEAGLLGASLLSLSVMLLVRGLLTPDVLLTDSGAVRAAPVLTLVVGIASIVPLVLARTRLGGWVAHHWRDWVLMTILAVFVVAGAVVFFPDAIVGPGPRHPVTVALAIAFAFAFGQVSLRHARLLDLGRRPASLVASASVLCITTYAAIPISATGDSPLAWWSSVVAAAGVVGACVSMVAVTAAARDTAVVLGPIVARDPFAALELGLHPVVRGFVADLDRHDPDARAHVVRTSDLALRVGERYRLSPPELRDLGLAAMLHDIGKVCVPDAVLDKCGELTPPERDLVHQHTIVGERMLLTERGLERVAAIVRSHHERFDGTGYPDATAGREIPLAARIIAACDALDAMTHHRVHRPAMPLAVATMVLRDHAGTQWDPTVVDHIVALLPTMQRAETIDRSRTTDSDARIPVDISALLASVDAEI